MPHELRLPVRRHKRSCTNFTLRNSGRLVGAGAVIAVFNGVAIYLAAQTGTVRAGAELLPPFDVAAAEPVAAAVAAAAAPVQAVAPAAAARSSCMPFLITAGGDYVGHDLRTVDGVTTLDECCAVCTATRGCGAFTYRSSANACFLKTQGTELVQRAGCVGGKIAASAVPTFAAPAGFAVAPLGRAASAALQPVSASGASQPVAHGASVSQPRNAAEAVRMAALENPPPPAASATAVELSAESKEHEHGNAFPTGYIRKPRLRLGTPTDARLASDDGKLHVVFSSGCNYFQHWQAENVLASAFNVGQRGRITRIVSGCHDVSAESIGHRHQTFPSGLNDHLVPLALLNRSVNPYFGLYITPTFEGARDFPWINKPSGIHHFLTHAKAEMERLGETVIAILDPDFIFLKPLTQSGEALEDIIYTQGNRKKWVGMDQVKKGRPVAQRYGIGGGWVHRFPVAQIVGAGSHALTYTGRTAAQHFSVGPPMMLHVEDALPLSKLWQQYMKPVLEKEKDILADMWAYSMASAHLKLEHTIVDQHMVSTWNGGGEGFPFIDAWTSLHCR